jgi:hypothetical protein
MQKLVQKLRQHENWLLWAVVTFYYALPLFCLLFELLWNRFLKNEAAIVEQFGVSIQIFNFIVAICYFITFVSTIVQVRGLIGIQGILPFDVALVRIRENELSFVDFPCIFRYLPEKYWKDSLLIMGCYVGMVSSTVILVSLALGWPIASAISMTLNYVIYLNYKLLGREFWALQFDNLILECGILFVLLQLSHSKLVVFLPWFLLARLHVGSGLLKLMTEDETWWNGTALCYHWWTQPMPNVISYYAHHLLPKNLKIVACGIHFFIEIAMALFGFLRPTRFIASLSQLGLQIGILLTGNYGTFNILTGALCILFIENWWYPEWMQRVLTPSVLHLPFANIYSLIFDIFSVALIIFTLLLSYVPSFQISKARLPRVTKLENIYLYLQSFAYGCYYGLFGRMTTVRHEVIVLGSNNMREWKSYEFKYKIGDVKK